MTLCMVGCIVAGTAKDMGVLIGMRCVQGAGCVLFCLLWLRVELTRRVDT